VCIIHGPRTRQGTLPKGGEELFSRHTYISGFLGGMCHKQ